MYYTLKMRIKKEMREERRERRRNRKKQTATRNVSDYSSPSPPTRGGKTNAELLTGHGSLENILFYDHLDGERMEGRVGEGGGRKVIHGENAKHLPLLCHKQNAVVVTCRVTFFFLCFFKTGPRRRKNSAGSRRKRRIAGRRKRTRPRRSERIRTPP